MILTQGTWTRWLLEISILFSSLGCSFLTVVLQSKISSTILLECHVNYIHNVKWVNLWCKVLYEFCTWNQAFRCHHCHSVLHSKRTSCYPLNLTLKYLSNTPIPQHYAASDDIRLSGANATVAPPILTLIIAQHITETSAWHCTSAYITGCHEAHPHSFSQMLGDDYLISREYCRQFIWTFIFF